MIEIISAEPAKTGPKVMQQHAPEIVWSGTGSLTLLATL